MKTIAVYSKPLGGIAGRTRVYPDVLGAIDKVFRREKGNSFSDFVVTHIGDRVICLLVYEEGQVNDVANIVWEAFSEGRRIAKTRKLFESQIKISFTELKVDERETEEFVLFLAGSDNKSFWDFLPTPEDQAAKGPSVCICRTEGIYCTTPELLEIFAEKETNKKGISPVSLCDATIVRTRVTPVVALGFSLGNGILTGPLDLFDTPQFEAPRFWASECALGKFPLWKK
ncbi:MAG TPA: fructose 1,6-bisphosphatase [Methanocorpusculum sp.]|nr:fructose 1,6-bisphosphatase [Methanocorpusculum sp.]